VLFAFDIYDRDSSGVIESNEVATMLEELYGKNYNKNKKASK
jgi:Ca2+-binding EF-hand superfamily protein